MTLDRKDAGLVCLAGLAVTAMWVSLFGDLAWRNLDLYPTYIAAQLYLAGIYDGVYHEQLWIPGQIGHPAWVKWMDILGIPTANGTSFVYSPAWLVLIAPVAGLLSLYAFTVLFFVANALATAFVGYASVALAGVQQRRVRVAGAVIAGCSMPALAAASLGQNTALVLSAVLLGYHFLQRKEGAVVWSGVGCWVLAATMKPWCVLLLLLLPLLRGWRITVGALAGYGVTNALLPALFLPSLYDGYRKTATALVEITVPAFNNIAIRAHLLRLRWPDWLEGVQAWQPLRMKPSALWLEGGLVVGLALLLAWGIWRRRPERAQILALGCGAVLFAIGVTWTHYLLFAFPLYMYLAVRPTTRWLGVLLVASLVVWAPHPLAIWPWDSVPLPGQGASPLAWAWRYFSPMLLLLVGLIAAILSPTGLPGADKSEE